MPRVRELQYGRTQEWQERMSDRLHLADGSTLDMLDHASVRAYVRRQLALSVDPTPAQLKRLEMLEEHAAKLEAKQAENKSSTDGKVLKLLDPKVAAEVLRQRLEGK